MKAPVRADNNNFEADGYRIHISEKILSVAERKKNPQTVFFSVRVLILLVRIIKTYFYEKILFYNEKRISSTRTFQFYHDFTLNVNFSTTSTHLF